MDIAELLIEFSDMNGPSGFEEPVSQRFKELLEPVVDEIRTDVMGNVIGVKHSGREGAKKLLLDAHIDEIGFIVTGHEEGFLKFSPIGGINPRALPAACVNVLIDPPVFGVVGVLPPHVLKSEDTNRAVKIEDLSIDVGMSQDAVTEAIPLGTPIVVAQKARRLGEKCIAGKALDDRAGVVSLLRAMELIGDAKLNIDLYVMASVQEEVGVRGAVPAAYGVNPDWSIIVDVGFAKTPDMKAPERQQTLGGGVMICRGPNMNKQLTEQVVSLAKAQDIKYQIEVEPGGNSGTNARAIQISRGGVATALLSIPLKYMHSPAETVSVDDIETTAKLMCEAVKMLSAQV